MAQKQLSDLRRLAMDGAKATSELLEALNELLIDMRLAQTNMRAAAKRDPAWEGCAEAIQPRVDAAIAAIKKAESTP